MVRASASSARSSPSSWRPGRWSATSSSSARSWATWSRRRRRSPCRGRSRSPGRTGAAARPSTASSPPLWTPRCGAAAIGSERRLTSSCSTIRSTSSRSSCGGERPSATPGARCTTSWRRPSRSWRVSATRASSLAATASAATSCRASTPPRGGRTSTRRWRWTACWTPRRWPAAAGIASASPSCRSTRWRVALCWAAAGLCPRRQTATAAWQASWASPWWPTAR
mmetsp:Transcript_1328/g.3368  ORF Transcript_1328/g.3368 Transcript_1328/m.3368 type:complete len:225 (-) Transcript_1328:325-999(-)